MVTAAVLARPQPDLEFVDCGARINPSTMSRWRRPLTDLEFVDRDGYVWKQDPFTETWTCRDYDDAACGVSSEWLAEHRGLVTA